MGLSLGAEGAMLRSGGTTVDGPGLAAEAMDNTGAGGVFRGAFRASLVWGWPLPEVLRLAKAVAALRCRMLGGRPT